MRIEADRISRATSKHIDMFVERVEGCEPYAYRMRKAVDGKCVFLEGNVCLIYKVRPLICRFYPFGLKDVGNGRYVFSFTDECACIGKGPVLKREYFERLFKQSAKLMEEDAAKRDDVDGG